jgi:hypothetical protein
MLLTICLSSFAFQAKAYYSQYLLQNDAMNFADAREFCQEWGGDLITIKSESDMDEVVSLNLLGNTSSVFIGLTDSANEG